MTRPNLRLEEDELTVELQRGAALSDPLCNDLTGKDHRLDQRVPFVSGRVAIVVAGGAVDIELTDLRTADGRSVEVGGFRARIGPSGG